MYNIVLVAYDENGQIADRAHEPCQFWTLQEAEAFIADWGSRWVLYPTIEIWKGNRLMKVY